jgi:hypothetical protein
MFVAAARYTYWSEYFSVFAIVAYIVAIVLLLLLLLLYTFCSWLVALISGHISASVTKTQLCLRKLKILGRSIRRWLHPFKCFSG